MEAQAPTRGGGGGGWKSSDLRMALGVCYLSPMHDLPCNSHRRTGARGTGDQMLRLGALVILVALCAAPAQGQARRTVSLGIQFVAVGTEHLLTTPSAVVGSAYSLNAGFGADVALSLGGRWSLVGEEDFIRSGGSWQNQLTVGPRFRLLSGPGWRLDASAQPGVFFGDLCQCATFGGFGTTVASFALYAGVSAARRLSRRWIWRLGVGDLFLLSPQGNFGGSNLELATGVAFRF